MLIKGAVREDCKACGHFLKEISPEQYGCDQCRKQIEPCGNDERLDVSVFHKSEHLMDGKTEHYYFCSWKCVFDFVQKLRRNDYFFTLPYACADHKIKGRRMKDFFAELYRAPRRRSEGR